MENRKRGRVARWSERGFGFIEPGGVFVHVKDLPQELKGSATDGTIVGAEVEYSLELGPKGSRAINVAGYIRVPDDLKPVVCAK